MSNIKAFLKQNVKQGERVVEFKVSDRFEETIKLKKLSGEDLFTLQDKTSYTDENGMNKSDIKAFASSLMVACIEEPDLLNAELLESYGVLTPHQLINEMFEGDEYMHLFNKCSKLNGLNKTLKDLEKEAKN